MRLIVLIALAAGLSACAPRTFDPTNEWELLREFRDRSGAVQVEGERMRWVRVLRMDPDSSSWVDTRAGTFRVVPTRDVRRIQRNETAGVGARRGAMFSMAVASVLAVPLIVSDREGWGALLGTFMLGSSAVTGAAFGAIIPMPTTFRPRPPAVADTAVALGPRHVPRTVTPEPFPGAFLVVSDSARALPQAVGYALPAGLVP